jgi:hypothetical protein
MLIGAALACDDDHCEVILILGLKCIHLVNRIRGGGGKRGWCALARRMRR